MVEKHKRFGGEKCGLLWRVMSFLRLDVWGLEKAERECGELAREVMVWFGERFCGKEWEEVKMMEGNREDWAGMCGHACRREGVDLK